MEEIRLIDVKEEILSENKGLADEIRNRLAAYCVFMVNVMGSPGAGKTSLILSTIDALSDKYRMAVVEADIDSFVDSEKVAAKGVKAVQIRTGGFCHIEAAMVEKALESLPLPDLDLIILENVGNLVCPAESDTGAIKNIAILSVPEGDDKPLKYPLMFVVSDVLVVNKIDYLDSSDFSLAKVEARAKTLNSDIHIFPVSCKLSDGLSEWINWIEKELKESTQGEPHDSSQSIGHRSAR